MTSKTATVANLIPLHLGITNPKFSQFRPIQIEGLKIITSSFEMDVIPVTSLCIPTGGGKWLLAFAIAKTYAAFGLRTLILTHTLGLQDQAELDSECDGLVVMKGRSNSDCINGGDCDTGFLRGCNAGPGCTATILRKQAEGALIVSANYAYWLTTNRHLPGVNPIGKFDIIIMDEAHEAHDLLSAHLTVNIVPEKLPEEYPGQKIGAFMLENFPPLYETPKTRQKINFEEIQYNVGVVKAWADGVAPTIDVYHKHLVEIVKAGGKDHDVSLLKKSGRLVEDVKLLRTMTTDNWAIDNPREENMKYGQVRTIKACPIFAGMYNHLLFQGIPMSVLMSATLLKAAPAELGVPKERSVYKQWGRVFPNSRNPVYYVATADLNYETEKDPRTRKLVLDRIEAILLMYEDFKGIIPSVSYDRADWIAEGLMLRPRLRKRIMTQHKLRYEREPLACAVRRHIDSPLPTVLIGPGLATGWDLVDDQCRFIIVPKLPLKPVNDLIARLRREKFPKHELDRALTLFAQMVGRGSRSLTDWCASYLLDTSWEWFTKATYSRRPDALIVTDANGTLPPPLRPLKTK